MKLSISLPLLAVALVVSSSSSFVSGQDFGVMDIDNDDNDLGGTRGFRQLKADAKPGAGKPGDKKKNNNKNQSSASTYKAPVGAGGIAETSQCEANVAKSLAFIAAAGHADKGSTACFQDPVNGCPGGCCRIASVFFICDADNSSSRLPCVCNDLTNPLLEQTRTPPTVDAGTDTTESTNVATLEDPVEPILVGATQVPTMDATTDDDGQVEPGLATMVPSGER